MLGVPRKKRTYKEFCEMSDIDPNERNAKQSGQKKQMKLNTPIRKNSPAKSTASMKLTKSMEKI